MKSFISGLNKYVNIKTIVVLSFIIALLKIIISLLFDIKPSLVEDYKIAVNLVNGLGYTLYPTAGATAIKAPVYPLFLASLISLFSGKSIVFIAIAQHILSAFYPIITYKIMEKIVSPKAAFLTSFLWLIHPSYLYYSFAVEATNLFIFIALIWLLNYVSALKRIEDFNIKSAVLLGFLSALCYLVQPISSAPIALALVYLFIKLKDKKIVLVILSGVICITPWTVRNYMVFDKFIPGKSPVYMNVYVGFLEMSHGRSEFNLIDTATQSRIDTIKQYKNDVLMEKEFADIVIPIIKNNTGLYLKKCLRQAYIYWNVPPRYSGDFSLSFIIARRMPVILLNIAFLISMFIIYKNDKKTFSALLLVMLYFTAVYSLTATPNIRFKLDSEWLIFLAIGLAYEYLNKSKRALNISQIN